MSSRDGKVNEWGLVSSWACIVARPSIMNLCRGSMGKERGKRKKKTIGKHKQRMEFSSSTYSRLFDFLETFVEWEVVSDAVLPTRGCCFEVWKMLNYPCINLLHWQSFLGWVFNGHEDQGTVRENEKNFQLKFQCQSAQQQQQEFSPKTVRRFAGGVNMWIIWNIIWMLLLLRRWRRRRWAGDGRARRVRARLGRCIVDDLLCEIKLVALLIVVLYDVVVVEVDEKFAVVRVDVTTLRLSLGNDVRVDVRILNVADLIALLLMVHRLHMMMMLVDDVMVIVMHLLGLVLLLQLLAQVLFVKMLMRFLRWFDNFIYCFLRAQVDSAVVVAGGRLMLFLTAIGGRFAGRKASASILEAARRADNYSGGERAAELLSVWRWRVD